MMHFRVTSLDEIDFSGLVAGSLPRMDAGTYVWPAGVETNKQKEDYLRSRAEAILAQPNALCFKCVVDGEDLAVIFGSLEKGILYGGFSLVRPDANGSRSFIYRQDVLDSQKQFLTGHGASSIRAAAPVASPLMAGLEARHSIANAKVLGHGDDYRGMDIEV